MTRRQTKVKRPPLVRGDARIKRGLNRFVGGVALVGLGILGTLSYQEVTRDPQPTNLQRTQQVEEIPETANEIQEIHQRPHVYDGQGESLCELVFPLEAYGEPILGVQLHADKNYFTNSFPRGRGEGGQIIYYRGFLHVQTESGERIIESVAYCKPLEERINAED